MSKRFLKTGLLVFILGEVCIHQCPAEARTSRGVLNPIARLCKNAVRQSLSDTAANSIERNYRVSEEATLQDLLNLTNMNLTSLRDSFPKPVRHLLEDSGKRKHSKQGVSARTPPSRRKFSLDVASSQGSFHLKERDNERTNEPHVSIPCTSMCCAKHSIKLGAGFQEFIEFLRTQPLRAKISLLGNSVAQSNHQATASLFAQVLKSKFRNTHFELDAETHNGVSPEHIFNCGVQKFSKSQVVIFQYDQLYSNATVFIVGRLVEELKALNPPPLIVILQHCHLGDFRNVGATRWPPRLGELSTLFPPECPEVDEMAQAFPEAQAAWDDYNRRRAGKSAVPQPSDGRPSQNFDSLSEAELSDLAYQRLHPQATACRSPEDAGRWPAVREGEAYLAHKYNLTLVSMCNVFRVLMGDPSLGCGQEKPFINDFAALQGAFFHNSDWLHYNLRGESVAPTLQTLHLLHPCPALAFPQETDGLSGAFCQEILAQIIGQASRQGDYCGALCLPMNIAKAVQLVVAVWQWQRSLVQGCLLSRVLIDMLPNGGFELGEDVDDVEYTSWGPMRTAGPPPPPLTYLQSNSIELPSTKTRCMESQPAEGREHGFNVNATSLKGWIIQEDDRHGHRQRWYEAAATDAYMEIQTPNATALSVKYYMHHDLPMGLFSVQVDDNPAVVVDGCCQADCVAGAPGQGIFSRTQIAHNLPDVPHRVLIKVLHRDTTHCSRIGSKVSLSGIVGSKAS
ncbi:hypothetical protein CYMTET_36390 [Cymbomonas tetramitiformis]|uniref:Uncharacterized protein n=1 Tax=Cymbomonas tetramitiformis TaxID=36881 RepID=A0AAE0CG56_9CHLO|nr:hypothetical protein CYMTET_36390 [Cymbomonas tetramitiformis]